MPTGPKKLKPEGHTAPERGTTAQRGYGGDWPKIRLAKLAQNPVCEFQFPPTCTGWASEVDHILPLSQGGTNEGSNLRSTCKACHCRHHKESHPAR